MAKGVGRLFEALADPTRRQLVQLLSERPRRAGEIAQCTGLSGPAMSRHCEYCSGRASSPTSARPAMPGSACSASAAKVTADRGSPAIDQLAFADFLARGEFDRHLRRMRPVYRRRRDALLRALRERLPDLEPAGVAAGLHPVPHLPGGRPVIEEVRATTTT